jgi:hypothetical protein
VPIEDMHSTVNYRIRQSFELTEMLSKLSSYGDIRVEGESCFRFLPKNPDWPESCIYEDGRIFIIAENHFADEIDQYITELSDIIGMEIESE